MSAESQKLTKMTQTIAENLGIRFCTSCNKTKPAHGGKTVPVANGRTRWKCASCALRMKESGFKTTTKGEVQ
jgi:hypothetical protein